MRMEHCTLCPRNCGAVREEASGSGFCGMGANPVVARAALHFWEEPCISGKRGSGTVFFTGCSLKCVFCQNYQISTQRAVGKSIRVEELADKSKPVKRRKGQINNTGVFVQIHILTVVIHSPSV